MEEILLWFATLTGIIAAIIVASNLGRKIAGVELVIFTASSTVWIVAGFLEDLPSLMVQNAVLTVIYALGIYRWFVMKGERQ